MNYVNLTDHKQRRRRLYAESLPHYVYAVMLMVLFNTRGMSLEPDRTSPWLDSCFMLPFPQCRGYLCNVVSAPAFNMPEPGDFLV